MYLHLGQDVIVRQEQIIGIFDLDNTSTSKRTRDYLARAEKAGRVVNVSYELPKSFVVCQKDDGDFAVYITPISSTTLRGRQIKSAYRAGMGDIF